MVAIIGEDRRIMRVNNAVKKVLGGRDPTGEQCYSVFHGTSSLPASCFSCAVFETGCASHGEIFEESLGNRWFDLQSYPVHDASGHIGQVVHCFKDITDRKRAESALRDNESKFQKEKARFMKLIVHELKSPVAASVTMCRTMQMGLVPQERTPEYVDRITKRLENVLDLIRQALSLSHAILLQESNDQERTDLVELLRDVCAEYRETAELKDLEFNMDVSDRALFTYTDRLRLQVVLSNLLSNAVKYTDAGSITITLGEEVDQAIISIADTGGKKS